MESQETVLKKAIDFVNKVMLRLRHRKEDFKSFLNVLKLFKGGPGLLHGSVSQLFRDDPDLLLKFEEFHSDSKPSPGLMLSASKPSPRLVLSASKPSPRLVLSASKPSPRLELSDSEFSRLYESGKAKASFPSNKRKRSSCGDEPEPNICNTDQRCIPSSCVRTTLSLSPMRASKRSKLDDRGLNDQRERKSLNVSGEFSHKHIEDIEEKLEDDLEDVRHELDMVLASLREAVESADELLQNINNDVADEPKNHQAITLPFLLRSLSQRKEEAIRALSHFN